MSDLISRSELKQTLIECLDDDKIQEALNFFGIYDFIDDAPTAYNVEEVVQQIKEIGKNFCVSVHCNDECQDCEHGAIMRSLIEVVRNSGSADVPDTNVGSNGTVIEMIKLDDNTYVPKECCTITNPATSGGISFVDDVDMPCGANCENECSSCIIQRIMNEYAKITKQTGETNE